MANIESILEDIPYLSALESSASAARSYKKFALPDIRYHCIEIASFVTMYAVFTKICSVHSVVAFYLKDHGQLQFKYIYRDQIGTYVSIQ